MAVTGFLGGLSLTLALQTVWENPAADNKVRTVEFRFCNQDGQVSADITQCLLVDSSAGASHMVLPVNATVEARDALSIRIVLDPGDKLQASASAAGDIYATAFKILEEAA